MEHWTAWLATEYMISAYSGQVNTSFMYDTQRFNQIALETMLQAHTSPRCILKGKRTETTNLTKPKITTAVIMFRTYTVRISLWALHFSTSSYFTY